MSTPDTRVPLDSDSDRSPVRSAEQELQDAERRFRAVFAGSLDAILIADDAARYVDANPAACELFGASREDLLGRSIGDFAGPGFDVSEAWAAFLRNGTLRGVFPLLRPDGQVRQLEFSASAGIQSGRHLTILRDVTELRSRYERLEELHELTQSVARARDLDDIYSQALAGLKRTLRADRAAVLLADEDGVMRFRAWDGLSEAYRRAAEGHSPWNRRDPDPRPVLISSIEDETSFASLRDVILGEGIRALGFIPLIAQGALIGKLMIYFDAAHDFSPEDVRLATTVASQVAFAIERQRREEELLRRQSELTDFVENAAVALHWVGPDERVVWANRAELEMLGYSREEYIGHPIAEFHADPQAIADILFRLVQGETLRNYEADLKARDGSIRHVLISSNALWKDGKFVHTRCFTRDMTDWKEGQRLQRMHFDITRVLAESVSLAGATPRLLSAICDTSGWDAGALWLVEPERQRLRCVDFWQMPGTSFARFEAATRERTFPPGIGIPGRVWASAAPAWIPDLLEDSNFPRAAVAAEDGLRSACGFPVIAPGAVVGVLEFFGRDVRQPEEALIRVLGDAGSRIGQFVERMGAAEALREREARYRALFENTPDGILIVDDDGRYVDLNESFCRILRAPREQLLGAHFRDFIPEDRLQEVASAFEDLKRTGTFDGEFPLRAADGKVVEVEWMARSQVVPGLSFCSARDITARKVAEQRERFLAEASAVLAGSLDYETTLAEVARLAVPAIADWAVVDLLERDGSLRRLGVGQPSPRNGKLSNRCRANPAAAAGALRVLETGTPVLISDVDDRFPGEAAEAPGLDALPSRKVCSSMILPLAGASVSGPFGVISLVTAESGRVYDSTDLRLAQELASRAGLAIENARLYREAEEASAQKTRFLSAVSHDLRTPVNAILLNAVLVRQQAERYADADANFLERCRRIESSARSFADLLTNLLEIGSFESGQKVLREEVFSIRELAFETVENFQSSAHAHGLDLTLATMHRADSLRADRTEVSRVLNNLLSNAIKFTESGRIDVETEEIADGDCAIRVRDTGPGIPAEHIPSLFSEFFQVRNPERDRRKGTGLGLAISRRIMEALGGSLQVESELGHGSVFTAVLPRTRLSSIETAAQPIPPVPRSGPRERESVLVIDDDQSSREALAQLLASEGYVVRISASGQEGLSELEQFTPDVVLLDMMMPGLDGLEVVSRIRDDARHREIRIIALTGDVTRERLERASAAGVDGFVGKPFHFDTLLDALQNSNRSPV